MENINNEWTKDYTGPTGDDIKEGSKVFYTSPHGSKENGIVKSLNDSGTVAWVVYHCDNEWDNYKNYTGAATNIKDLQLGWFDSQNQSK